MDVGKCVCVCVCVCERETDQYFNANTHLKTTHCINTSVRVCGYSLNQDLCGSHLIMGNMKQAPFVSHSPASGCCSSAHLICQMIGSSGRGPRV